MRIGAAHEHSAKAMGEQEFDDFRVAVAAGQCAKERSTPGRVAVITIGSVLERYARDSFAVATAPVRAVFCSTAIRRNGVPLIPSPAF